VGSLERVATGAHFLSFVTGSNASLPSLAEALARLPRARVLVINADGLSIDDARAVETVLRESGRPKDPVIGSSSFLSSQAFGECSSSRGSTRSC
jgi:hypothetical protein